MKNDVLGLVGLAWRARRVVSGEDACVRAVRSLQAKVVILAGDAGANTAKKVRDKCASYGVPVRTGYTCEELGRAVGKLVTPVIALTDAGFAKGVFQRME